MDKLEAENKDARHVLEYIFKQIVSWKKLNQELWELIKEKKGKEKKEKKKE